MTHVPCMKDSRNREKRSSRSSRSSLNSVSCSSYSLEPKPGEGHALCVMVVGKMLTRASCLSL